MTEPGIGPIPEAGPNRFQVGGSLPAGALTYVTRDADGEILDALRRGFTCSVLDARQMGKSSLQVRTRHQLESEGARCAFVDLNRLGTTGAAVEPWFAGLAAEVVRGFGLLPAVDVSRWWRDHRDIPPVLRLDRLLRDEVLARAPGRTHYLFLDEIDAVLSLDFPPDDLISWIRSISETPAARPDAPLVVAIFGAIVPAELIHSDRRTPFNIGRTIALGPLRLEACGPLAAGLSLPESAAREVLAAILDWTGGQPFLTQKICRFMAGRPGLSGTADVDQAVREVILTDWRHQDEPIHLRTIERRVLSRPERSGRRLGLYGEILDRGDVPADGSVEEQDLLISGLVVRDAGRLRVRNRLYREVFHREWVEQQLTSLRPWAVGLAAWEASGKRDESRLLRGRALREAQEWAQGRRLSESDHHYLAASVECERLDRERELLADRAREAEARLAAEEARGAEQRHYVRRLRALLAGLAVALLGALVLGVMMNIQARRALRSEATAAREAAASHQVTDFLTDVFSGADPTGAEPPARLAGDLLDRAAHRLDTELRDQPLTRARLASTMGEIFDRRGDYTRARSLLETAREIQEADPAAELDLALTLFRLGNLNFDDRQTGSEEFGRALQIRERRLGPGHVEVGQVLDRMAVLNAQTGHYDDAADQMRRCRQIYSAAFGDRSVEVARLIGNLAGLAMEQEHYAEALPDLQMAQAIFENSLHPDDVRILNNLEAMALDLSELNRPAEAIPLEERAIAGVENRFGPEHPRLAAALGRLSTMKNRVGRHEEAERLAGRALGIRRRAVSADNPILAVHYLELGIACRGQGRLVEAERWLRQALTASESYLPPGHVDVRRSRENLVAVLRQLGRSAEADSIAP